MAKKKIQAYSYQTDTTYDSWEELVAAESDGYVVIVTGFNPEKVETTVFSNFVGRRANKHEASLLANRTRRDIKKRGNPFLTYKVFVRPNWNW